MAKIRIINKPNVLLNCYRFAVNILAKKVACKGVQDSMAFKIYFFCFQQGREPYSMGVSGFCG